MKPKRPGEAKASHQSCMETFEGFLEEAELKESLVVNHRPPSYVLDMLKDDCVLIHDGRQDPTTTRLSVYITQLCI